MTAPVSPADLTCAQARRNAAQCLTEGDRGSARVWALLALSEAIVIAAAAVEEAFARRSAG